MALFLAALLIAGCGRTPTSVAPGSSTPAKKSDPATASGAAGITSARCAGLVVLGLRGQGQAGRGHDGAGPDVDGVARAMVSDLPRGTTVRIAGVPYPARSGGDATYDADVSAGVRLVHERIAALAERCPHSRVVLAGYSQGAEVVHRAATARDDPTLVAVVLMADPLRNPHDTVTTTSLGTGELAGRGNGGPGALFPAVVARRVLEVCVHADDVCNAPSGGRVGPASAAHHTAYKNLATQRRVAREVARLAVSGGN